MKRLQFFKQHIARNKWAVLAFTLVAIVASVWTVLAQTTSMDSKILSHIFGTMVYGLCISGIGLITVAQFPSTTQQKIQRLAYFVLALLIPVLDTIWFYFCGWEYLSSRGGRSEFFYHILSSLCLLLVVPVLPFVKQKDDLNMQIFSVRWVLLAMLASWVVGAVFSLLEGLLAGTFALFSLEFIDWLFGLVAIWGAWLGVVATLGVMPDPEQPGEAPWAVKLGKRVFLPVLLIYIVVLLVYLFKIVFLWELPNGTVTYMVSAMMIQLVVVWILVYPMLHLPEQKWERWMRYLPLVCLPLVVLMSIGLYRRFSDYGITIGRVYAVALNVWFYLLILVLTWRSYRSKPLTFVLTSLAAGLILLTSIPYINARDYTHRRIVHDINELMTDSVSGEVKKFDQFSALKDWLQTLPQEQGEALASKWNYMLESFGDEDIPRWMTDTASAKSFFDRFDYRRLVYNSHSDTLHMQTVFDFKAQSWSSYPVPRGEWVEVCTHVWSLHNSDIRENSENPSELIIPILYRDFAGDECTDTICLDLGATIGSQGLCVPTYKGNAVSFQRLIIKQNTQKKNYEVDDSALLFLK